MMKIPKQEYTTEFRELAVNRHKEVGSISGVAKELGLVEQTLRNWVKAAELTLSIKSFSWCRQLRPHDF